MSKKSTNPVKSTPEASTNIVVKPDSCIIDLGYKTLEYDNNTTYQVVTKKVDMNAHKRFYNVPEAVEAPTHFTALQIALNGKSGVTMTSKNVRIYIAPKVFLMCWRRAGYIRVYTTTPEEFNNIEWQEYPNPNETVTHVAHLTYNQVLEAIKDR